MGDDADPRLGAEFAAESVGDPIFGGSRFMTWSLGPVALIAGIGLATTGQFAWDKATAVRVVIVAILLLLAAALFAPRRCAFAGRIVTGLVFLVCVGYVVEMAVEGRTSAAPRSEPSLGNALQCFVVFGIPCFWLTVRRSRR